MKTTQEGLKREVGVWGLSANIVNIMVGAGIFVLPAIIAETMGLPGSWLTCLRTLIGLVTLCFASRKRSPFRRSLCHVETAFGPYPDFWLPSWYN